jgi:hypothetical protein
MSNKFIFFAPYMICRSSKAPSWVQDIMFSNLRYLDYLLIDFTNHNEWYYIRMDTATLSVTTSTNFQFYFCQIFPYKRIYLNLPMYDITKRLDKKFPALYGTWRFMTTFTSAHNLSLSWARSVQSMPPPPHNTSIPLSEYQS